MEPVELIEISESDARMHWKEGTKIYAIPTGIKVDIENVTTYLKMSTDESFETIQIDARNRSIAAQRNGYVKWFRRRNR